MWLEMQVCNKRAKGFTFWKKIGWKRLPLQLMTTMMMMTKRRKAHVHLCQNLWRSFNVHQTQLFPIQGLNTFFVLRLWFVFEEQQFRGIYLLRSKRSDNVRLSINNTYYFYSRSQLMWSLIMLSFGYYYHFSKKLPIKYVHLILMLCYKFFIVLF